MSAEVLVVEGLTVRRDTYVAVQEVSFSLDEGTDTAIVGPNGAGKSTLVQAILGILPRSAGEVWVLGHPLSRKGVLPPPVRQQIAYLPQNFLFDRRIPLTVNELVALGWNALGPQLPWAHHRSRRAAVRQALDRVDALPLGAQPIAHLSGGELKRALLAYCLVRPRRLLILDEAPAGLDVQGESEFYRLLYQLTQEQGWSILQISHNLDMVRQHCDRVLCLNRILRCQGSPDDALAPQNLASVYGSEFVRYQHRH